MANSEETTQVAEQSVPISAEESSSETEESQVTEQTAPMQTESQVPERKAGSNTDKDWSIYSKRRQIFSDKIDHTERRRKIAVGRRKQIKWGQQTQKNLNCQQKNGRKEFKKRSRQANAREYFTLPSRGLS